jgi:Mrp family chromosome partitioning ATPase
VETTRVVVPIELRGETIGSLIVQTPATTEMNQDQLDLIKAVAERVAISAENARLFDETTRRAERERTVSDITGKIRSVNDPPCYDRDSNRRTAQCAGRKSCGNHSTDNSWRSIISSGGKMAFTIALSNEKGGVAKTTSTLSLGAALAELNHRVLLIDLDPQANLSLALGFESHEIETHVGECSDRECCIADRYSEM